MADSFDDLIEAWDAWMTFEIGFAAPLTQQQLTAHLSLQPQPGQTAQQLHQAECAAQPTIGQCCYDELGRPRARPYVEIATDRAPNGYDHRMDLRQGRTDPGGLPIGFWDYDPVEIERQNAFTPVEEVENPAEVQRRALSPWPEVDTSVEAMYAGSLAEEDRLANSAAAMAERAGMILTDHERFQRLMRLPSEVRIEVCSRVNRGRVDWSSALSFAEQRLRWQGGVSRASVLNDDAGEIARRLYELPQRWREHVVRRVSSGQLGWIDALDDAAKQARWERLTVRQKDVFRKVKNIERDAADAVQYEQSRSEALSYRFRALLQVQSVQSLGRNLFEFFSPMITSGFEAAWSEHGVYEDAYSYWDFSIQEIDGAGEESNPLLLAARAIAVLKIVSIKRMQCAEKLCSETKDWMQAAGDAEKEVEAAEYRGAFWYMWMLFEQRLRREIMDYGDIDEEAAAGVTQDELHLIMRSEEAAGHQTATTSHWEREEATFASPVDPQSVQW